MVTDILKQCRVEGLVVKLPETTLERNDYLEVKNQLQLIGGKWKGGKTQGFVFEQDPTELLNAQANGDGRNLKKEHQFFATPKDLADEMVEKLAGYIMRSDKVLEPSAGDGSLIKALLVKHPRRIVDCFETMDLNRIKLNGVEGANLVGDNFLLCNDRVDMYDYIIANPPFTKNQDIVHIAKMYQCLKPGGTIVTLASKSWQIGSQKLQKDFVHWLGQLYADIIEVEPGRFKDSGTMVSTLLLTISKPLTRIVDVPESIVAKLKEYSNVSQTPKINNLSIADIDYSTDPITEEKQEPIAENIVVRTCRDCGCTESDCRQCIKKTGKPCHWVEQDLCSACYLPPPEVILEQLIENEKSIASSLKELKTMLQPDYTIDNNTNTQEMNFFQELINITGEVDLTLRLKSKFGKITVGMMPAGNSTLPSLNITGTAVELDEGFINAVRQPLKETVGLVSNIEEYKEKVKEAVETASTKLQDKSKKEKDAVAPGKTKSAAANTKSKASPKLEKSKAAPETEEKSKPEPTEPIGPKEQTLF